MRSVNRAIWTSGEPVSPSWRWYSPISAVFVSLSSVLTSAPLQVTQGSVTFDRSPVKSIRYKGMLSKIALGIFAVTFVVLAYLGLQPATPIATLMAQIFTALYFAFFLLMPIYSKIEKTKPVPERVTE